MKYLFAILLVVNLSGCVPMALMNTIRYDTACEAYNSDVQRGSIPGPARTCKDPMW